MPQKKEDGRAASSEVIFDEVPVPNGLSSRLIKEELCENGGKPPQPRGAGFECRQVKQGKKFTSWKPKYQKRAFSPGL